MPDEARQWNRVKQVFQHALEQPAEKRDQFCRDACGGDRELQRDMEPLLPAHGAAGSFAQQPAIAALSPSAADALLDVSCPGEPAPSTRFVPGTRLGRYEIVSA